MPVIDEHPEYKQRLPDWQMMNDAIEGDRAIKGQGVKYLPKTSGMIEAESLAAEGDSVVTPAQVRELYASYLHRADYPLWVKDSLRTMMGMVSRLEPEVNLPARMAILETDATSDGFSAKQLFMRICSDLLIKGRKPLLCDFDDSGSPYVATYEAEDAPNWAESNLRGRSDLILVVFKESRKKPGTDEFNHESIAVYRVLDILEGNYRVRIMNANNELVENESFPGMEQAGQSRPVNFLPVVFAGSTDNNPSVDEIPLITMAKAALKYYVLSADYYQSLHYTAHPQPVITGLDGGDLRVTGAMAAWTLPVDGKAFYLEFTGTGVEKTRDAMMDQRGAALEAGARVIDTGGVESGDARRARQDDQHATLHSVVAQAAGAVQQCFRYIAEWMGENPDEVIFSVEPKFTTEEVDAAMVQIIGNLVMSGEVPRPVLYNALRKSGITDQSDEELDMQRDGQIPVGSNE